MHDGFSPHSNDMTIISKDEYKALVRIKSKHEDLLFAIEKLQRYKAGFVDIGSQPSLTMLPCQDGGFIRFTDLTDLTLSYEEITKRNMISKLDNEINRLFAERAKLLNGK